MENYDCELTEIQTKLTRKEGIYRKTEAML